MKKLSLLFVLSFGLLAQAAEPSEIETGEQNTELTQAELAAVELYGATGAVSTNLTENQVAQEQSERREDQENGQQEEVNKNEKSGVRQTPKSTSRYKMSFLAGVASGASIAAACYAGIELNVAKPSLRDMVFATTMVWPARVALNTALLRVVYRNSAEKKYENSTLLTSAAIAQMGSWAGMFVGTGLIAVVDILIKEKLTKPKKSSPLPLGLCG